MRRYFYASPRLAFVFTCFVALSRECGIPLSCIFTCILGVCWRTFNLKIKIVALSLNITSLLTLFYYNYNYICRCHSLVLCRCCCCCISRSNRSYRVSVVPSPSASQLPAFCSYWLSSIFAACLICLCFCVYIN